MSYLYRHALFVSRTKVYLDWANGLNDDGPQLGEELSRQQRNVYLVPESAQEPDLNALLNEFWEDIFAVELRIMEPRRRQLAAVSNTRAVQSMVRR